MVALLFSPADRSPVRGDQVVELNGVPPEFERRGAPLFGIAVASGWNLTANAEARGSRFPLLADFDPKGSSPVRTGSIGPRRATAPALCSSSTATE